MSKEIKDNRPRFKAIDCCSCYIDEEINKIDSDYELGISTESVRLAANGKRVKVLEDLEITIERIE